MPGKLLVCLGKERFKSGDQQRIQFTKIEKQDAFLNDLEKNPHAYVLGCLMDRRIKSEKAWQIPYTIKEKLGSFTVDTLASVSEDEYVKIFKEKKLHVYNEDMAKIFYAGIRRIKDPYKGDASQIWRDKPSSATVVYRFLEFKGCGIKIATMAANILARQFNNIPFADYYSIDISPDVHTLRVLRRTGLVPKDAKIELIIYKARELNPEFPGIIDHSCWEIGRTWCSVNNPQCSNCPIGSRCGKHTA